MLPYFTVQNLTDTKMWQMVERTRKIARGFELLHEFEVPLTTWNDFVWNTLGFDDLDSTVTYAQYVQLIDGQLKYDHGSCRFFVWNGTKFVE